MFPGKWNLWSYVFFFSTLVRRLLLCEELERSSCGSVLFHGYLPPPGTFLFWCYIELLTASYVEAIGNQTVQKKPSYGKIKDNRLHWTWFGPKSRTYRYAILNDKFRVLEEGWHVNTKQTVFSSRPEQRFFKYTSVNCSWWRVLFSFWWCSYFMCPMSVDDKSASLID